MKYSINKNKIVICGKEDFNPQHILECGQMFRYTKTESGYTVFSSSHRATILETCDGYEITCSNEPSYFEEFFNLKTDYKPLKEQIIKDLPFMESIIKQGHGIRIIKGDLFEVIASFIISQNNNIKRIKNIINKLCEAAGEKMEEGHFAFPSPKQFAGLTEDFFVSIGAGYRAKYLSELSPAYNLLIKEDLSAMPTITLRKKLLEIKGIGPKVADCILLFAFNRFDVFPVDVWIERVYYEYFSCEKRSRIAIRDYLTDRCKNLSGYIQQYLFYHKITKN